MMYKNNFLVLAAIAGLIFGGGSSAHAQAQAEQDRARLCQTNFIEVAAPYAAADDSCYAPAFLNEGGLCVTHSDVSNVFSYIIKPDQSLDFGLSYWFANGAHCGIIGNAEMTETGWRYINNIDADPEERCMLDITIEEDMVLFDAHPNASCRPECGAQAVLSGTFIAFSALESRNVTQDSFHPEVFYNTPCRE